MRTMQPRLGAGLLPCGLLSASILVATVPAQTTGDNGSHDPSRMMESEGKLFIYSTGGGMKSSRDGQAWTSGSAPAWNRSHLSDNQGIWAPDIFHLNGKFHLYGSMWSEANKSSALVLLTSPALDPASPQYGWTDQGVVVPCPSGVTHSCIDPAPFVDQQGKAWLVWGGGYPFPNEAGSLWLTPLDKATGLPLASDPAYAPPNRPGHALKLGHKEAPYIHFSKGYYYLWWQTGSCCSGTASTYTMHVARSTTVTGPYSGDRVFYASKRDLGINGPGHMGIYACGDSYWFTYHYYPTSRSVVGLNTLTWGADGWPIAGLQATSPLRLPCGSATALAHRLSGPAEGLRVRRADSGHELHLPGAVALAVEVLDPAGRLLGRMPASPGGSALSAGSLRPGLNLLRIRGEGKRGTTSILETFHE